MNSKSKTTLSTSLLFWRGLVAGLLLPLLRRGLGGGVLLLIFTCFTLSAQNNKLTTKNKTAIYQYEKARSDYNRGETAKAETALIQAIDKDKNFIEAYLLLGDVYSSQKDYLKQMNILIKADEINSSFYSSNRLNIGIAAYNAGLYDDAIKWLKLEPDQSKSKVWIDKAKFALEMKGKAHPNIELVPVGDGINSNFDEYWPSLTADEQTMVFTVLLPRDMQLFDKLDLPHSSDYFQEDLFESKRNDDGVWQIREPLKGKINSNLNEGTQSLSSDGTMMFFTACDRDDSKGSCDIYFCYKTADGWSEPKNVGEPVNSQYYESQPCFASDGKTLLFVSNRLGGYGGNDIWQATVKSYNSDGMPVFGNVTNLGNTINSPKDEHSPFLHHDCKTLYFSSDGWPGMGQQDVFISRRNDKGEWSKPENFGYPINTAKDEIGLVVNARGTRAYFSTENREGGNRDGKSSGKNIYWLYLPPSLQPNPSMYVKVHIFDSETKQTVPADCNLQNEADGKNIDSKQGKPMSGEYTALLPFASSLTVKVDHQGYMFYSGHFKIDASYPVEKTYIDLDVPLIPIKTGVKITLENIFYEFNSFVLLDQSKAELDRLVSFLKENSSVKILISGHTDNVGAADYNQKLSQNRAESVYKYLISKGINADRLQFKGFGTTVPVADNNTEEGRAKNRRTEITIL